MGRRKGEGGARAPITRARGTTPSRAITPVGREIIPLGWRCSASVRLAASIRSALAPSASNVSNGSAASEPEAASEPKMPDASGLLPDVLGIPDTSDAPDTWDTKAPPASARPISLQESRAGLLQCLARDPTVIRSVTLVR